MGLHLLTVLFLLSCASGLARTASDVLQPVPFILPRSPTEQVAKGMPSLSARLIWPGLVMRMSRFPSWFLGEEALGPDLILHLGVAVQWSSQCFLYLP